MLSVHSKTSTSTLKQSNTSHTTIFCRLGSRLAVPSSLLWKILWMDIEAYSRVDTEIFGFSLSTSDYSVGSRYSSRGTVTSLLSFLEVGSSKS